MGEGRRETCSGTKTETMPGKFQAFMARVLRERRNQLSGRATVSLLERSQIEQGRFSVKVPVENLIYDERTTALFGARVFARVRAFRHESRGEAASRFLCKLARRSINPRSNAMN